jgi:deoxyribose-phosphate aldolase
MASKCLADSGVKVATVIGFPFGYSCIEAKVAEVVDAIANGADEVDVVANIAAIKNGDWEYIEREITQILQVIRANSVTIIKVIIESGVLTEAEVIHCCKLYGEAGIDFLKTSTGFAENGQGASLETVKLFQTHLPATVRIKASGGIRDFATAQQMVVAGASRIGCSAGVKIMMSSQEDNGDKKEDGSSNAY